MTTGGLSRQEDVQQDIHKLKKRVFDEVQFLRQSVKHLDRERREIDKCGSDSSTPLLHRMLEHVEHVMKTSESEATQLKAAKIVQEVYGEIRKERAELMKEAGKRAIEAQQDLNRTSVEHRRLDIEERLAEQRGQAAQEEGLSPDELERLVNGS